MNRDLENLRHLMDEYKHMTEVLFHEIDAYIAQTEITTDNLGTAEQSQPAIANKKDQGN